MTLYRPLTFGYSILYKEYSSHQPGKSRQSAVRGVLNCTSCKESVERYSGTLNLLGQVGYLFKGLSGDIQDYTGFRVQGFPISYK